jgi:PhzF family phenazine biosynthesis protein
MLNRKPRMKTIPLFQVDAFTIGPFTGNPAGVCPLESKLSEELMQKIAAENNLAETAFLLPEGDDYQIRWFTPLVEVDLCGHGTLASAYIVLKHLKPGTSKVTFNSLHRGPLYVTLKGEFLELDFPVDTLRKSELPPKIRESINVEPMECVAGSSDYLLLLRDEDEVLSVRPDFRKLAAADGRGIIVTARGKEVDFVSRFFAPQAGIDEDPVTGSAHTTLTPFWAERLGRKSFKAMQLSSRRGYLECTLKDNRVLIAGRAILFMKGEIFV